MHDPALNLGYDFFNCFLQITYADIAFFSLFNVYLALGKPEVPEEFAGYPLISSLYERVMEEPRIGEHLKTRTESFI